MDLDRVEEGAEQMIYLPALDPMEVPRLRCGPGRCFLCSCSAFTGTTYQCDNCGHQWGDHFE